MNELVPNHAATNSSFDLIVDVSVMESMYRLAETMAQGKATVPEHLQGNTADCMAIVMQSAMWKMNPFAVAQKTHSIFGVLGYEAQLVNAVVTNSGLVEGAFEYEFFGDWERVIGKFKVVPNSKTGKNHMVPAWTNVDEEGCGVKVYNTLTGESDKRVLELLLSQAQVRNSTMWASDPKQQLAYLGVKKWARLYCPAAILGVYSVDELEPDEAKPRRERDITPDQGGAVLNAVEQATSQVPGEASENDDTAINRFQQLAQKIADAQTPEEMNKVKQDIVAADDMGELSQGEKAQIDKAYRNAVERIKAAITKTNEPD